MFIGFRIPWKYVIPALLALGVAFHTQIAWFIHAVGF
jgi:hypothetical protein